MQNFDAMVDDYILGLTEQGFEPEVVEICEQCGAELYRGEEVVEDECGTYFCDVYCAKEFHGIEEIIL